ncbi:hypothetical protein Fmac_001783 [Flemingia macrophylla]|uniref:Uncharacterized protein n=1 Tax=Flemingia macrophylla TaxID=520843 RepID=A0ABD1NIV7_9FABA
MQPDAEGKYPYTALWIVLSKPSKWRTIQILHLWIPRHVSRLLLMSWMDEQDGDHSNNLTFME